MEKKDIRVDSQESSLHIFTLKVLILLAITGGLYTLSLLVPVLTILFFSGFLTILFSPFLASMKKRRIPDWLGLIWIFFLMLLFLLVTLFAIIPIFTEQIGILFTNATQAFAHLEELYKAGGINALGLPSYARSIIVHFNLGSLFELLRSNASSLSTIVGSSATTLVSGSTSILASLSGGLFQMVMIVVFTFFMSLERKKIKAFLYGVFPGKISHYLQSREDSFVAVLKSWIRGQIILGLSIFLLTLTGLFVLKLFGIDMDNILTLALIAGLMEFIPYIGPFIALLPALAIAAGMWFPVVITVFILYIVIQQTENNVLVPMVMGKTLDISPFLILLTMTVMASLFGIAGVLLAIPLAAIMQIIVRDAITVKK